MYTLYLLAYNNYYNRTYKRLETPQEYRKYIKGTSELTNYNFNESNGLNTTAIVNLKDAEGFIHQLDYLIVFLPSATTITSRWFITGIEYIRKGQYNLTLRRDVIADFSKDLFKSPIYLEKSTLNVDNVPFIYNKEGMNFNQIKTSETLIKDETNSAWIVGYIPSDAFIEEDADLTVQYPLEGSADITVDNINNWPYYKYINNFSIGYPSKINHILAYNRLYDDTKITIAAVLDSLNNKTLNRSPVSFAAADYQHITANGSVSGEQLLQNFLNEENLRLKINANAVENEEIIDLETYNKIKALNNLVIYESGSNSYYKITFVERPTSNFITGTLEDNAAIFNDNIKRRVGSVSITGTVITNCYKYYMECGGFELTLEPVFTTATTKITKSRYHLTDQPFDMFAMPYSDTLDVYKNGTKWFTSNSKANIAVAQQLAAKLGSNKIYDLQLLPYCPVRYMLTADGKIDVRNALVHEIKSGTETVGCIMWSRNSSFNFTLPCPIAYNFEHTSTYDTGVVNAYLNEQGNTTYKADENKTISKITLVRSSLKTPTVAFDNATGIITLYYGTEYAGQSVRYSLIIHYKKEAPDAVDLKVINECDKYRLVSPNYNGQFDFNLAINGGLPKTFVINCTYKPFNPYIHVAPEFGGLYGNIQDVKGLICGGDFSLPQLTSAWADYESQNKNYQVMFDRQIQNLETNRNLQKTDQIVSAFTGTIAGAATGLVGGGQIAGLPGGITGAVVGGIATGVGGAVDLMLSDKAHKETLDYTTDMYNYNLQNIQALPYSLTKVGSFNIDNKLFPFVEYYTCTDAEKEAFKNKMLYNGMTVNAIFDNLAEVIDTIPNDGRLHYVKGKLIRVNNVNDVFTTVAAYELNQGLFFKDGE